MAYEEQFIQYLEQQKMLRANFTAEEQEKIEKIVDRALQDDHFYAALIADPIGTAQSAAALNPEVLARLGEIIDKAKGARPHHMPGPDVIDHENEMYMRYRATLADDEKQRLDTAIQRTLDDSDFSARLRADPVGVLTSEYNISAEALAGLHKFTTDSAIPQLFTLVQNLSFHG
ncbi:MAG: hypothetical protein U0350_41230 [Caldilineaceae bacterium]